MFIKKWLPDLKKEKEKDGVPVPEKAPLCCKHTVWYQN
jgi:hypothetical protein